MDSLGFGNLLKLDKCPSQTEFAVFVKSIIIYNCCCYLFLDIPVLNVYCSSESSNYVLTIFDGIVKVSSMMIRFTHNTINIKHTNSRCKIHDIGFWLGEKKSLLYFNVFFSFTFSQISQKSLCTFFRFKYLYLFLEKKCFSTFIW